MSPSNSSLDENSELLYTSHENLGIDQSRPSSHFCNATDNQQVLRDDSYKKRPSSGPLLGVEKPLKVMDLENSWFYDKANYSFDKLENE
jgi:hypothetical protein